MKHGRPEDYRGPLTPASAAEGMNAARRNARRLADDAKLLLDAARYPTAASLAALSIEESGKVLVLRSLVLERAPEKQREEWRRYRDHRSKNGMWILPGLAERGAQRLCELAQVVDRESEHTALLNGIKQVGLYTDCYGEGHWSEPGKVIDAGLATFSVRNAELLIGKGTPVTVREMELWVEFLRPSLRTPNMAAALLRWADAMRREGLSATTPEEYARFFSGEHAAPNRPSEPPEAQ